MFESPLAAIGNGEGVAALGLLFSAVLIAVFGAASLIAGRGPLRRRLAGDTPRPPRGRPRPAPTLRADAHRAGAWTTVFGPIKVLLGGRPRPAPGGVRTRLQQAGLDESRAGIWFALTRLLLAAAAPGTAGAVAGDTLAAMAPWQAAALLVGLAVAGLQAPVAWLNRRIARRQRTIAESFPDALDMMVVCVEAGLGLDAALARVATQIAPAHPRLAAELDTVTLELRAGKSREDALRNFAARVALPEVLSFVTLLVQSEALGAGIAQTLRVHAEDMRAGRLLRAEEMAHKLPVKLTIPLVLCILPAMLAAVLLPGMITIVRHILPGLGN